MEVHMFAEYASDGRLRRVHEMTRKTVTGTCAVPKLVHGR
jgi:hypothetical protein